MKNYFLIVACLCIVNFLPNTASAYFTTGQEAFTVDNKMAVFTIDFSFGHKNHDVSIPVRAVFSELTTRNNELSFVVRDKNDDLAPGMVEAIVLSDIPVSKGFYVIPKGKSATFTLLVIYKPTSTTTDSYTMQVTGLPFRFDTDKELSLNPSELQYYKTPALPLHVPLFVFPNSATFTIKTH